MLPQNKPDRIRILFDDDRLVANAGLILPATLAGCALACPNSSGSTSTSAGAAAMANRAGRTPATR